MTNPIGALFGRSPIRPMESHMDKAHGSVVLLGELLQACNEGDWDQATTIHDAIVTAEQDADEIKRDIRSHLPTSLFLPFARSDLLELLRLQDQLPNRCKQIASLLLTRRMSIPAALHMQFMDFYQINLDAAAQAKTIIHELDELLESGFRGKEVSLVSSLINQLDALESTCNDREHVLKTQLYQAEQSLPPIEVMFLHKLADAMGSIMSTSHRIGGQLLLLMAN